MVGVVGSSPIAPTKSLIAFRKRRCHGDQKGSGRFALAMEVNHGVFEARGDAFAASRQWDSASLGRLAF